MNKLWWLAGLAFAAIAIFVIAPLFRSGGSVAGPAGLKGQPAPVFAMRDDVGRSVSLTGLRGKVVVMNLWGSWCPPCRAELPDLQRLSQAYGPHGLVVVGVNQGESPQRARDFARSLGVTFPIWIDADQSYGRVYTALGLPTTVVIGRDGIVSAGYDGELTYAQMQAAVAAPLANAQ
ncbi:MAG: TlpA family protein disulfide reductase [Vulcanimicrobiaceae bacterium]